MLLSPHPKKKMISPFLTRPSLQQGRLEAWLQDDGLKVQERLHGFDLKSPNSAKDPDRLWTSATKAPKKETKYLDMQSSKGK
jgi:hypothetical protein